MLPVYSVGSEKEAQDLLVLACSTNYEGEFIAKELMLEQTVDNLQAFGDRLDRIHNDYIKGKNRCYCK